MFLIFCITLNSSILMWFNLLIDFVVLMFFCNRLTLSKRFFGITVYEHIICFCDKKSNSLTIFLTMFLIFLLKYLYFVHELNLCHVLLCFIHNRNLRKMMIRLWYLVCLICMLSQPMITILFNFFDCSWYIDINTVSVFDWFILFDHLFQNEKLLKV